MPAVGVKFDDMRKESDRQRWDRKYAAGEGPAHFEPKPFLVQHHHLSGGGRALDVACGFGGNALYLASLGYQVDAVDASGFALSQARAEAVRRGLQINLIQADLSRWWVPPARYDLILVFYYLNRVLMPALAAGLRPGGLLFQANRNARFLVVRPGFDPDYLLQPGELGRQARAAGLEVVYDSDKVSVREAGQDHDSRLIARKPVYQSSPSRAWTP
jgi:2-polyprenyl-3-methyl-5-hydroxy-6-metoxy-1,4-benzoquinol methylase